MEQRVPPATSGPTRSWVESMADRMESAIVVTALDSAVARRSTDGHRVTGCVLHSDRGGRFRSRKLRQALFRHRIRGSMGQVGAAGDNATWSASTRQPPTATRKGSLSLASNGSGWAASGGNLEQSQWRRDVAALPGPHARTQLIMMYLMLASSLATRRATSPSSGAVSLSAGTPDFERTGTRCGAGRSPFP